MQPKSHILAGIFLIILFYFLFPNTSLFGLALLLFSSIFIDADHYLYYIFKEKDFNLTNCYKWYKKNLKETLALPMNKRKNRYTGFYIFHGVEWLIILLLISCFVFPNFIFIFFGFLFHNLLDIPHEYYVKRTFHKISLIYSYTQWKKFEK